MTVEMTTDMKEALIGLLKLAGTYTDGQEITSQDVQQAVEKLKSLIIQISKPGSGGSGGGGRANGAMSDITALSRGDANDDGSSRVLIAGQLGIITHQLRQALSKEGAEIYIANDVDEAITQYQKRDFSRVFIDLYMPTVREGLIVLDEIKKLSMVCNLKTAIVVLAPPSKDRSIKEICKTKGADVFIEKVDGWHKSIVDFYLGKGITEEDD